MSKEAQTVAIVTGASSGIGEAAALALSKAGFRVFGTCRNGAKILPGISMLACDVTDDASVANAVEKVLAEAGRIDVLVNNAGLGMFGAAEVTPMDAAKALFDVNVFGVARMSNAVLPAMRRQRAGRIVNLSSVQGFVPVPGYAFYAATKHAVEGYSQSLDHELRALGIRVSVVEPGFTRTAFENNLVRPDQTIADYESLHASVAAAVTQEMEKGDTPETVADCIVKAATDSRPRLRYPAGKSARTVSLLRRFAPSSAFDKNLRKMFGLPA